MQQIRLEKLSGYISQKIAYIEKIIALKNNGDDSTIKAMLTAGEGKFLMDKIREFNQNMQSVEEKLFTERQHATGKSIRKARVVFWAEGIFAILITLFLASIIISELNRRTRVEKIMNDYNRELRRKNQEIEQFAYIASHDLQQPLRSISNFTSLLNEKTQVSADSDAKEYMRFITGAAKRMSALISDLLEYSRVGNDTAKSKIDLNALLKEILTDMSATIQETKAEINIGILPTVNGYVYLKSLFQNLISNAIKFTRENKTPVVTITSRDMGAEYLFSIKDNGIGIEKEYKERIFVIFQRLHTRNEYPGTGIGLSICKKIVDLHGGSIWVESVPGEGSTFNFTIPKL